MSRFLLLFLLTSSCTVAFPKEEKDADTRAVEVPKGSLVVIIPQEIWQNPQLFTGDLFQILPEPQPFPESY